MPNICDTFARNFVPKSFQKSPNLDTLLPLSKDISEHKMEESHFGGMNGREREVVMLTQNKGGHSSTKSC